MKLLFAPLVATLIFSSVPAAAGQWGEYIGEVVAIWLPGGREMKLVSEFSYKDPKLRLWTAPTGSIVDGASIPQVAWSLIGGPFEGKYREASVIHDVACAERKQRWEDVHEAFYYAMLASGVEPTRAKVMYSAVYFFGPRWDYKYVLKAVSASRVSEQISELKRDKPEASTVVAKVKNARLSSSDSSGIVGKHPLPKSQAHKVVDIYVQILPDRSPLHITDFDRLRQEIESKDLTLEQIRSFNK